MTPEQAARAAAEEIARTTCAYWPSWNMTAFAEGVILHHWQELEAARHADAERIIDAQMTQRREAT